MADCEGNLQQPSLYHYSLSCFMELLSSPSSPDLPVRAVIIDDSQRIRELVRIHVERYFAGRIVVIGEAADVDDSVALIRRKKPQLVLLDIELITGTGFDVLDILHEERATFTVSLITTFEKYVRRALEYGVVSFIDKPILVEEFKRGIELAIKRVREKAAEHERLSREIEGRVESVYKAALASGTLTLRMPETNEATLVIRTRGKGFTQMNHTILIRDIVYCLASGSYTTIFRMNAAELTASKAIGQFEEQLKEHGFLRITRSLLVNPRYCKIRRIGNNEALCIMPNGSEQLVEKQYQADVLSWMRPPERASERSPKQ